MKTITNRKYKVMLPILLIGLAIMVSFGIQTASAVPSQLYVSNTGSDTWSGQSPTWNGTDGPKQTIKNATKTVINDGTVHIASGTYNENNIADFSKNINFLGENKYQTIINGNKIGGLFSLGAQGATYSYSFSNLQFINGNTSNGGAIYNLCANTLIDNCIFKNNIASYSGSAIHSFGTGSNPATITITNCNFTNNTSNNGVIYNAISSVSVTGSDFTNNIGTPTTILWNTFGTISNFQFNRIVGTGNLITSDRGGDVSLNWWGSNSDPSAKVTGVTVGPWLVLKSNANPVAIATGATSIVTADLQHDSNGAYYDPVYGFVPDGIVVTFANDTLGTVNPLISTMINGAAYTTFKGIKIGTSVIKSTVDSATATAKVIITVPPVVTGTDPINNAVDVTVNKVIKITFSKSIKFGTNPWIELKNASGTPKPFTQIIKGNTLTITPKTPLAIKTKYTLILHANSVTDLNGIGLASTYTSKFTTTTPPVVTSTSPINSSSGNSLTSPITIKFSENIAAGANYSKIYIKNLTTGKIVGITQSISGNTLTIKMIKSRLHNNTYQVNIPAGAIKDKAGNNLAAKYTFKFKTA